MAITVDDIITNNSEDWCLNIALFRQCCAGNAVNRNLLKNAVNAFPTIDSGGFNYWNFPTDEWKKGTKICNYGLYKDYPWLYLKPYILEKILKQLQIKFPKEHISHSLKDWGHSMSFWIEFDCCEPLIIGRESIDWFDFNKLYIQILKRNDKDRLQEEAIDILRGEGYSGTVVYGRQHTTTTSVGHLSNKVCST